MSEGVRRVGCEWPAWSTAPCPADLSAGSPRTVSDAVGRVLVARFRTAFGLPAEGGCGMPPTAAPAKGGSLSHTSAPVAPSRLLMFAAQEILRGGASWSSACGPIDFATRATQGQ
jgi:hypothetical protein